MSDTTGFMRQKRFWPFPKVTKTKAAGKTEDAEDGANKEVTMSGALPDYNYLLGMAMWSLTKEKV
jgi:DNA topoisomerase-2